MKRIKRTLRDNLASIFLVIATFLNPLGFDVAFYTVMQWTESYWVTTSLFYLGSALFFGLYYWLRNKDKKANMSKNI